ncbi:MAG: hypothetical protein OXG39_09970 [Chloroflexi bacterium]|nr:hypothetical protein [Chloroflexota bacterium]
MSAREPRTLRSASIALGRLERDGREVAVRRLPEAEIRRLYAHAAAALDAVDAATPIGDADGRRRLAAVERRYRRIRAARGDRGLAP